VKFVTCSNCGGPVSLEEGAACAYCASPVTILATETIEKTLRELHAKDYEFTIKRLIDPKIASPNAWLVEGRIEGIDAGRVDTNEPDPSVGQVIDQLRGQASEVLGKRTGIRIRSRMD
jgi:hypothetical protein